MVAQTDIAPIGAFLCLGVEIDGFEKMPVGRKNLHMQ